jgi:hypothetical protein
MLVLWCCGGGATAVLRGTGRVTVCCCGGGWCDGAVVRYALLDRIKLNSTEEN